MQAKGERPGPEDAAGAMGKAEHLWAATSNPKGSRLRKWVKEASQGTPSPRGWESREQRQLWACGKRRGLHPCPPHTAPACACRDCPGVHPWSLRMGRGPQGCLPE